MFGSSIFTYEQCSIRQVCHIVCLQFSGEARLDLPPFGYRQCHKHFLQRLWEHASLTPGICAEAGLLAYRNSVLSSDDTQNCFWWSHQFTFPPATYLGLNFSTSFLTLVLYCFSYARYSRSCKAVTCFCFFDFAFHAWIKILNSSSLAFFSQFVYLLLEK